jgi:putative ABC transport system permease protein
MNALIILKVALRALARNKLRSSLTALGLIIGVAAVVALVGIGNGAKAQIEARVASMGLNVLQIKAGSVSKNAVRQGEETSISLTLEDAEAIKKEIAHVVAVSPEVKTKLQAVSSLRNWKAEIYGESPEYFSIRQWPLKAGEYFTEQDVHIGNTVAVLGSEAAAELFGDQNPVGEIFRVQSVPFLVIGVLEAKGETASGDNQDDSIIVPISTAMQRLIGQKTALAGLRRINVQADSPEAMPEMALQIARLLHQRHGTEPAADAGEEEAEDFKIRSQLELAETATQSTRTMTMLLAAIAGVSLIVGGIGIMNIMLVSVTERTREIGIRMAVGAYPRDIRRQFLIEALTLSCLGGMIGIAIGVTGALVAATVQEWPAVISLDSVLVAFVFSAAVGVFFGFYPARKASQLDPIEALRYE